MIDVCLINPRSELKEITEQRRKNAIYLGGYIYNTPDEIREPPNGIMILAEILSQQDYSVEILDLSVVENPDLKVKEISVRARLFGITCLTNTLYYALNVAKTIKKEKPESIIVFGGPHASFEYENMLKKYPFIDVICIGESENSFPGLVTMLLGNPDNPYYANHLKGGQKSESPADPKEFLVKNLSNLPKGIAFYHNNRVFFTGFPDPTNLDGIPIPARYLIPKIYTVANILVNRGCPNKCSFCSRSRLFQRTRLRPMKSIIREIHDILEYSNYKYINFYDNINVNKKYFNEFLHNLINIRGMLPWGAELRADIITEEDARLMKRAKCAGIATGVETVNEDVLNFNGKFQNIERERLGIINLKKAGIAVQLFFIIGLPGETMESFRKNFDFIRNLPLNPDVDKVEFFLLTPYPGADIVLRPEYYGIKTITDDYEQFNCHEYLVETRQLNINQIKELHQEAIDFLKELGFPT